MTEKRTTTKAAAAKATTAKPAAAKPASTQATASTARAARSDGKTKTTTVKAGDTQASQDVPVTTGQKVISTADVPKTSANPTGDPAALQFPSLVGHSDIEIAERSADQDEAAGDYRKVYVAQPAIEDWKPPADSDIWHGPNKAATLQEAINRGLHPSGEASYTGAERHPDGFNWCLTYSVPVIPAAIDEAASLTFSPAHSEYVERSTPTGATPANPPA